MGLFINLLGYFHKRSCAKWAYKFFSEPQKGRFHKNKLPVFLQQATFQYLKCPDTSKQYATYAIAGNRETILLVHGWESNSSRWEKLLPYLSKSNRTVVIIDAPAHGQSDGKEFSVIGYAKAINEAIKHYKPQIIIGHSIGGTACLYCIHKYQPLDIEKIIILGAPSDMQILLNNYANLLDLNSNSRKVLQQYIETRFNVMINHFNASNFVKSIKVSGIIAHDENDPVVSVHEGLKIAENWPAAKLLYTNTANHAMHDANLYNEISAFIG